MSYAGWSIASRRVTLLLYRLHEETSGHRTVRARVHRAVHRHAESEAESVIEPGLQVYCLVRYETINVGGEVVYHTALWALRHVLRTSLEFRIDVNSSGTLASIHVQS